LSTIGPIPKSMNAPMIVPKALNRSSPTFAWRL
jgi:hypothetical protein